MVDQFKSSQGKDLVNEWEQFSQAIKTPKEKVNTDQAASFQTLETSQKIVETVKPLQRIPATQSK